MCDFCKINDKGLAENPFIQCLDMGFLGEFITCCGIETDDDGDHNLVVTMAIDHNQSEDTNNFEDYINCDVLSQKINFCPMCGSKLGK